MRARWMAIAALATVSQAMGASADRTLRVYLQYGPEAHCTEMSRARAIVSRLFDGAGIHVDWRMGGPKAHMEERGADETIWVRIEPKADAAHESDQALAYSLLHKYDGVRIHVFLDRVRLVDRTDGGLVLGHVLAHEMGHVLEGVARHSEAGVLKANYTMADLRVMANQQLRFAPVDVGLMRAHFLTAAASVAVSSGEGEMREPE
jgi:hypothetical protein